MLLYDADQAVLAVVFAFGITVTWGMSDAQRSALESRLEPAMAGRFRDSHPAGTRRSADYPFTVGGEARKLIANDTLHLAGPDPKQRTMLSYGLAQDLFLGKLSRELDIFLSDFRAISQNVIKQGYSNLPRQQVYKIIGKVFVLMNSITLKKGILDTPRYGFYKEHQADYNAVRHYHNITPRAEEIIGNARLILDFYHILANENEEDTGLTRNMQMLFFVILFSIIHFFWNVVVM